jgi:hypothetical protein
MSNCKLQALYFAATEFEVLDEFEGEQGTFIKSFLINNKLNLNDWEVTEEANRLDGPEFKGMPGIEFFNKGRRDHTVGDTYAEALRLQSPHAKAIIRKVLGTETGEKLTQISRVFDEDIIKKLRNKEIKFVSPAIFPRSIEDVEIIQRPEGGHIHKVHRYLPLHYAFVDEPAYGNDAAITDICDGPECLIKLEKASATDGIGQDEIDPLRKIPIIRVSKCSKTGNINVSVAGNDDLSKLVSECLSNKLAPGEEPTDKDIAICFSESRNKLKENTSKIHQSKSYGKKMADDDITREEKEKLEARLTALEDTEKKREEEVKKAKQKKANETEDNHEEDMLEAADDDMTEEEKKEEAKKSKKSKKTKKANEEETEKEKEQTAKIASMNNIINTEIKLPKIASYLEYRESVGDSKEVIEVKRAKLLKASIEEINERLEEVAPHMASMQFNTETEQKSATTKFPYGLGGTQLSGSTNSKSAEQMYEELYE